jgi:predicted small integral membrane protein
MQLGLQNLSMPRGEVMLRILKIVLVASVAAYCLLGMLANIADWPRTLGSVGGVVSMATVEGGAHRWQATANPAIIVGGAMFIVLFKIVAGVTCLVASWRMWSVRRADVATFTHAKAFANVGCGVAIFGLYFGWTVIGEQVFDMWRSTVFAPSGNTAFRYGASIALIAIFVGMRDE